MKRSWIKRGSGFRKLSFDEAKDSLGLRARQAPLRGRSRLNANGRRTQDWRRVWRLLKPRLEAAGRVSCEFGFIDHECCGILDPAHSKKRNKMKGDDIYVVSLACRNAHRILDEVYSHEQMETAVLRAINNNGGVILPERRTT